jgi:cbb3-type cytochrome oxidase cytochrome c subunit
MSASRSVAAAQRRRAGPPDVQPSRGPNTSIQSSQAFSQQAQAQPMRPGTTGRLAGQQAAINQQQMQQQMQQQTTQTKQQTDSNARQKMTVPQAITLITLRLGRLENQMQNLDTLSLGQYDENGELQQSQPNNEVITSILQRLDALEQKSTDINSFKQQLDVFKPALVSIKNASLGNAKEVKTLKDNVEQMKTEIHLTKTLVSELQGLVNYNGNGDSIILSTENDSNLEIDDSDHSEDNSGPTFSPIVNLKDIIEQELNAPDS